jgi:DNA primase
MRSSYASALASVYSVRPKEFAGVSTPVSWEEVERGFEVEDFRLDNLPRRVGRLGDLWKPSSRAAAGSGWRRSCELVPRQRFAAVHERADPAVTGITTRCWNGG